MDKIKNITIKDIQKRIFNIRDIQVMVDSDLAEFYKVKTKVLNQAVKRNKDRFPKQFMFQLTEKETNELVTNCDRFDKLKHSTTTPKVFTEQGVAMLSSVLRSDTAVKISIQIIDAFVKMRRFLSVNANLFKRMDDLEIWKHQTNKKLKVILKAIESKNIKITQGVFYNGQIFDAYKFVSDIVRTAEKSIILIDNYIDDTVLTLFSKRKNNLPLTIYTKRITKQLKLDIKKFNNQYPTVKIKKFEKAHDRFLIIDRKNVYHFGASLKDLGKKIFAFNKMRINAYDLLKKFEKNK